MKLSPRDTSGASGPREPLLTVVVVNYNSWPDVARLVTSLAAEPEVAAGTCEVVVVDNASPEAAPAGISWPERGFRLLARRENDGFAGGVNAGCDPDSGACDPNAANAADQVTGKPVNASADLGDGMGVALMTVSAVLLLGLGVVPPLIVQTGRNRRALRDGTGSGR